jgi:pyrroline-5-carboxylate reductase
MPNTPALVGRGISAIAAGRSADWGEMKQAERIFSCVGEVVTLPESALNAVTAVSGSGPAYFFYLMEQMVQAGIELGLSPVIARRLVLQTAAGAARLAESSGEDPALLRARVTSKGGTTEAAFKLFLKRRLGQTIRQGIQAAAAMAKQVGR